MKSGNCRKRNQTMLIRLNKYLSDCGVSSRRKSEELILQGRVTVNETAITDLSFKVDAEKDIVHVDGEKISPKKHLYFLLNKPKGFITTTNDEKNRNTVIELINTKEKIFPIGRLDYNTTGVLLLTNDGNFSQLLTHPGNKVPREYEARLDKPLLDEDKDKFLKGIYLDGIKGKFTSLLIPKKNNKRFLLVKCVEGRNHFVKNMFKALGYSVQSLNRKSFAGILADISVGSYRPLKNSEINHITQTYGK